MNRRTSNVVSSFDVSILDVEDFNGRCFVAAIFGLAIVLIDDYAIEDVFHLDVFEEEI